MKLIPLSFKAADGGTRVVHHGTIPINVHRMLEAMRNPFPAAFQISGIVMVHMRMRDQQVLDCSQIDIVPQRLHIGIRGIVKLDDIVQDGGSSCADIFSPKLPRFVAMLTAAKCIGKALRGCGS
jgi:hypothetical protein